MLFGLTIFLSSFLLFQVKPHAGKALLPHFGGSPAVWTACMLFFQVALLGGYGYAHIIADRFNFRSQIRIHLGLLTISLLLLPVLIQPAVQFTDPVGAILWSLLSSVGIPYILLAASAPLLQSWAAHDRSDRSPYWLYGVSNAASFAALLSYPFIFEPRLDLPAQASFWSYAFAVLVVCFGGIFWKLRSSVNVDQVRSRSKRPGWRTIGLWLGLSASSSLLMLAVTSHLCQEVAVVPFMWIAPLSLYLLSFVLTFGVAQFYNRRAFLALLLGAVIYLLVLREAYEFAPFLLEIGGFLMALFVICCLCHGELYRIRPDLGGLTRFYFISSIGGALGGIFGALIAPVIFINFSELILAFQSCLLFVFLAILRTSVQGSPNRKRAWLKHSLVTVAILVTLTTSFVVDRRGGFLATFRNFYGVIRVVDKSATLGPTRHLYHGATEHGFQLLSLEQRRKPTAYYGEGTAVYQLFTAKSEQGSRIGVIGLEVGTVAAYANSGDSIRFYEIDPGMIATAKEYFTFLQDSQADISIVQGDGRVSLLNDSTLNFDILMLDAFSGDAIPVHLLTKEAFEIYLRHLSSNGVLLVHISNRYLDLRPLASGIAKEFALHQRVLENRRSADGDTYAASYVALARTKSKLDEIFGPQNLQGTDSRPAILWTDQRSNLFALLK